MRRKSLFRAVQDKVVERLSGNAEMAHAGLAVLSRQIGNVESEIDEALASVGMTIFVFPLRPQSSKPNMRGPHFDRVELRVRIFEQAVTNELGIDAWDVWEEIVSEAGLHHFRPPGIPGIGTFHIAADPFFDMSTHFPGKRVFDALFESQCNLTPTL